MVKTIKNILIVTALIATIGCERVEQKVEIVHDDSPKKLAIFGVEVHEANRTTIYRALSKEDLQFIKKINKWEEIWSSGNVMKEASQIKIGFIESGAMAYFQYDFPFTGDHGQIKRVIELAEKQYGQPNETTGEIGVGEYEANWDTGYGIRVSVWKGWQDSSTHLTYFHKKNFDTLQLEYSIEESRIKKLPSVL